MMLSIVWCSVYAIFLIHSADAQSTENTDICVNPLGVEDGSIPADRLSASSEDDELGPDRGRLNTQRENVGKGAWTPYTNDADQWIQADLCAVTEVTGVITQGRNNGATWVVTYEVLHSVDGENFEIILSATGEAEFSGNSDADTTVTNMFNAAVHAQFIRIHPTSWKSKISLRFELLGCPESAIHSAFFKSSEKFDVFCQRPDGSCTRCAMECMRALQCKTFSFDHNGCHLMPEFAGEQNMHYTVVGQDPCAI